MSLILQTPAKINPCLHLLGKRKDHFHEVWMHLVPIRLFDTLSFSSNEEQGVAFSMSGECAQVEAGEKNLVLRAVRAFEKATEQIVHQKIHLEKKIPVGAGLGGGSGNAAGTLHALNSLYDFPLPDSTLMQLAAELGSDVPFFMNPVPSLATGRGEILSTLNNPSLFPLIVFQPDFSIATAEAYAWLSKTLASPVKQEESAFLLAPHEESTACWHNQFESVLLERYPLLREIKEFLVQNGAFAALVSGSGSSIFGVFKEVSQQQHCFQQVSESFSGRVWASEMLNHHRYLES